MKNKYFIFLILIVFLSNCEREKVNPEEDIIAKVGDDVITAQEYRLNYEFGFADQKKGDNPEQAYLDKMIAELILAKEGYALKLDTASSVQHGVNTIRSERLIEEVFNVKVLEEIEVSEDEIRSEINKSAVSFQLRFLPAQSEPHARFLKQEVANKGYSQMLAEYSNEMMQGETDENNFQTPFLKAEEIDPVLLTEITNLELNQISEPVFYNQQWFLFMVSDIKRSPLAPEDYEAKRETYHKVIYNRKAMQGAEKFIEELMTPLDVRTKRQTFIPLADAFQLWLTDENPIGNLSLKVKTGDQVYHQQIQKILDEPLVEFDRTSWTVKDFLEEFNPGLYQIRPNDQRDFKVQFADAIALTVRDYHLLNLAEEEELGHKPEVQKEIEAWENKWVFQSMRTRFLSQLEFSDEVVEEYFEKHKGNYAFTGTSVITYENLSEELKKRVRKDYLNYQVMDYVEGLKSKYKVEIFEEKLAQLELNTSKKNPLQQVQLFKQNSNRMAFPVVDPNW